MSTVKVTMVKEMKGSPDGLKVINYLEGVTYDMETTLAEVFLKLKAAQRAGEIEKETRPPEEEFDAIIMQVPSKSKKKKKGRK